MAAVPVDLLKRYEAAGQEHLLHFYPKLSPTEQEDLVAQLTALDVERVNRVFKTAIEYEKAGASSAAINPLPASTFETIIGEPEKEVQWREIGLKAIAAGKVGVLLMAGGQGTRLGSSDPKGCYDIGMPSHKSLFQYQAERIGRVSRLAGGASIPWYVMTSGPTRKPTEAFFKEHNFFGLPEKDVIFFEQGTLPCLTMDGKILLDKPYSIAVAPDGNGGLYAALRSPLSPSDSKRTPLSDMAARGIAYIHTYGVDNCLVRVADPVFIGYSITKGAACGAKVVRKAYPTESVGVIAMRGDKFSVVEYSEITEAQANEIDTATGELAFRAANIVNHFYTREFLESIESIEDQMAFHIARKKIPNVEIPSGEFVKPAKPNGIKMELFVFDVFPFTQKMAVLEVPRQEEFSPLKNAPGTGVDDPQTSKRDLLAQQQRWLEAAGAKVAEGAEVEVSPKVTYAGEGLEGVKGWILTKNGSADTLEALHLLQ
ncbi:nucleotide-diphospho-sugar transferase [Calocera cornea HHB12733]|uniref:UDP-N-acetylglucosamine diphosphorylase n=1 Tax=Calocera cornea HHB12733 TaxID=1353952 RepID=A0A165F2L7_9BASI|nr:nucleotide-diphospho-sugar transferase [Calocera cornea HHB12733]